MKKLTLLIIFQMQLMNPAKGDEGIFVPGISGASGALINREIANGIASGDRGQTKLQVIRDPLAQPDCLVGSTVVTQQRGHNQPLTINNTSLGSNICVNF